MLQKKKHSRRTYNGIAYWDARDRERDRAYYRHKDSIDITVKDKVFLDNEELLDLEKVNEICRENLCDADNLDFDYMHIQEIVSNSELSLALNKLTEKQKFVLYMYGVEWYKTSEIAKIMNISPRGVRNHLESAKKSIMKTLEIDQFNVA